MDQAELVLPRGARMGTDELAHFPRTAHALVARLPLLTLLADFQRGLNQQFDSAGHAARYRPAMALQSLRCGVELLCRLQLELLHPALDASRPQGWPALGGAMASAAALRDLAAAGDRTGDDQQRALVALLEGLVQLQFASLDELFAEADAAAVPWAELERRAQALLSSWQAAEPVLEG